MYSSHLKSKKDQKIVFSFRKVRGDIPRLQKVLKSCAFDRTGLDLCSMKSRTPRSAWNRVPRHLAAHITSMETAIWFLPGWPPNQAGEKKQTEEWRTVAPWRFGVDTEVDMRGKTCSLSWAERQMLITVPSALTWSLSG